MATKTKQVAKKKKKDRRGWSIGAVDAPMLTITLILLMFGLVMLYSSSYAFSYLSYRDSTFYISSQLKYAILGVVAMFVASFVDYHIWRKFAYAFMAVTLVLMVAVFFMAPGQMDAHRWIWLNASHTSSFQPSEIAKFAVILLFAHLIATHSMHERRMRTFTYGFLPFVVILGMIGGLLFLQPHMSCLILVLGIGVCMMFAGGSSIKWFGLIAAAGVGLIIISLMIPDFMSHVNYRLTTWLTSQEDGGELIHQTKQSLIAIGSGGWTGLGIGSSRQKFLYLPEAYNDYIFAVVCEELGFVGAMVLVGLFLLLLWRGLYIAFRAKDKFGAMLAVGISVQIALQAFLHMAVTTNLIPSTGIALPFFSSGGTSLCMILGQMGILLSVSRKANLGARAEEEEPKEEVPVVKREGNVIELDPGRMKV